MTRNEYDRDKEDNQVIAFMTGLVNFFIAGIASAWLSFLSLHAFSIFLGGVALFAGIQCGIASFRFYALWYDWERPESEATMKERRDHDMARWGIVPEGYVKVQKDEAKE